jgi:hypothetical protein
MIISEALRLLLKTIGLVLVLSSCVFAQDDDEWPSLRYLRSDYKAVRVVAHVRVDQAEITNRIGGYENWKINAVVIEPFKGRFKKGDAIEFFHGAEAGFKREWFMGERIVFLLAERKPDRTIGYSVLENSTLPYTKTRVERLRRIKKQVHAKTQRKSKTQSPPGSKTTQITNLQNDFTGSFSVSPDGEWIVFERSKSLDDDRAIDLWIVPISGGNPRLLVRDASSPSLREPYFVLGSILTISGCEYVLPSTESLTV